MTRMRDPNAILCRACSGTGFDPTPSRRVRCETCGGSGMVKATDTATSSVDDPRHWRMRAEEMHTIAEDTRDENAKAIILKIAADYERVATRVAERRAPLASAAAPRDRPRPSST